MANYNKSEKLQIIRPIYDQERLNEELEYVEQKNKGLKRILKKSSIKTYALKEKFISVIPIFSLLQSYSFRKDFLSDFIAGCTVAIMHIPQGMGYALLANLPPIVGIYTAFFPVILYTLFGTSRHVSMGTFAVICIMAGKIVQKYSHENYNQDSNTNLTFSFNNLNNNETHHSSTPIEIASAVCLIVGIIQILMYILRLGLITLLLSESLVSGFTTGAAIQVLVSQIKELLGMSINNENNYFEVIYTVINVYKNIASVNWVAIGLSTLTMLCLIMNNEVLKSYVGKKCSFPIPMELVLVLGGTLISKYTNLNKYSIKTLKHIPTGFPDFNVPQLDILKMVAVDSIPIAIVAYTVSISMALIFAQKLNYEVHSNQELLAMGISNIFGSFFSCLPFAASLSRSIIQQAVGGKTQISSLISCGWLILILLWIGPFFEPLPRCVLAGIIVVSLKGMLWQVKHFFQFWKLDRFDAFLWISTFSAVVLISIDVGLLIGIISSIFIILFKNLKPYVCLLGNVPGTELFVDLERFKAAKEIPNIKIYHYCGCVNFASRYLFKSKLCSLLQIDLRKEIKQYSMCSQRHRAFDFEYLILDFSAVNYIDPSGIESLKVLINEFRLLDITVYITGASCPVYETMEKCELDFTNQNLKFFPSLYDAIHRSKSNSVSTINTLL